MNAVGKLGSYISKSVYSVSGPFHPFGGAVDIIVVEQPDGSFKSSPWYVRFGKFQGVLKAKEKVVSISVNGVEADFHMYLDHKGEAYFLMEVDVEEGETLASPSSSGEDTDGQSRNRRPMKSKSCNYDAYDSGSVTRIDISKANVLSRTNSRRSRILGLVFGRKPTKVDRLSEENNDSGVVRTESLERAEIAADLLEVKWSTNLASPRSRKDSVSRLPSQDILKGKELLIASGQTGVDSLTHDTMVINLDNCIPREKIGSANDEKGHGSPSSPMKSERSVEETGLEMSFLVSEYVIGTSLVENDYKPTLKTSSKTQNFWVDDVDISADVKDLISETTSEESLIGHTAKLEACPVESETSPSSRLGFDASNEQPNVTLCLSSGLCEQIFVQTLQTTDLECEVNSQPRTHLNVEEPSSNQDFIENKNYSIFSDGGKNPEIAGISSSSVENGFITETFSQMVTFQPLCNSVEDVECQSIFTISTFGNSTCQPLVENNVTEEDKRSDFEPPLEPVGDPQVSNGDPVWANLLSSEISEEEQLLFGDLDDFKGIDHKHLEEPVSSHHEKERNTPLSQITAEEANESFVPNHVSGSSADRHSQEGLLDDAKDLRSKLKIVSSELNIPATRGSPSEKVDRIARSLPNMWTHGSDLHVLGCGRSLGEASNMMAEANDVRQSSKTPEMTEDEQSMELKNGLANSIVGDSSRSFDPSTGSWRMFSFPFKRSRSMKVSQSSLTNGSSDVENITNRKDATEDEKDIPKVRLTKKKIRVTTPTSEQLASLNLKEGRNTVVFTFSTAMLGKQQVDARIYLWKWDTRIVISDVDGTITRSDLLGQVMPLVGVDWSQTGVAHLFNAIKENGYQLLFLSARAISQAYHTRRFLFNLKQDGKALPEGPVVISPDGLFPSLYREVVRRAPHEFKISCLEDIKALFPSDRNPFYAGFGNRDTDEISYLRVGIPIGKIFIINPKGEIVVNRRVDRKSYNSLHAVANDMFPSRSSSEQEDYNSWNYWKIPPPAIDI